MHLRLKFPGWLSDLNEFLTRKLPTGIFLLRLNEISGGGGTMCLPYLPVYKSTFYSLKISPRSCPQLIHGSKIFYVTIAYLKENSKIKDKFFKKILAKK